MRIKEVHLKSFKRFTHTSIIDVPESARLVILTGANGIGKSCIFEALLKWKREKGGLGLSQDHLYYTKAQQGVQPNHDAVEVLFYKQPQDHLAVRKALRFRSAYRHEPDFQVSQLERVGTATDEEPLGKLIHGDSRLSQNYRRLVSETVSHVYSGEKDQMNVRELREDLVGELRERIRRILPKLSFEGVGDPLSNGTYYFTKGESKNFHFKNLSAGEKAVLDLMIDMMLARRVFDNTVFCIDEPEAHLNAKLQGKVLAELFDLIDSNSQMWIATHSIGMLKQAKNLEESEPGSVAFIHLGDEVNYDDKVTIKPAKFDRSLWRAALAEAIGDLAGLIAPSKLVLCEGRPSIDSSDSRSEFDAKCLRNIFANEFPDVDFASVGSCHDVRLDRQGVLRSLQIAAPGTMVIRVVDRDDRTPAEVSQLESVGVRVLNRRNLESYLFSEEVLSKLCTKASKPDKISDIQAIRQRALQASVSRGGQPDDLKRAAGEIYREVKSLLELTGCGNDDVAFARDTLAPLLTPELAPYQELKASIFG